MIMVSAVELTTTTKNVFPILYIPKPARVSILIYCERNSHQR